MPETERTPRLLLEKALRMARAEGMKYVYLGNVPGDSTTLCSSCGKELIRRGGFGVEKNNLRGGLCPACGTAIAGIWL